MANYNLDNELVLVNELSRFGNMVAAISAAVSEGITYRKKASNLTQSARDEIDADVLSEVGGLGAVSVQQNVVVEMLKNSTPHVYRWDQEDETELEDGKPILRLQGNFYAVADNTFVFDPTAL